MFDVTLRKFAHAIHSNFAPTNVMRILLKIDYLNMFAKNIDCGYTLEGASNQYPQSMF